MRFFHSRRFAPRRPVRGPLPATIRDGSSCGSSTIARGRATRLEGSERGIVRSSQGCFPAGFSLRFVGTGRRLEGETVRRNAREGTARQPMRMRRFEAVLYAGVITALATPDLVHAHAGTWLDMYTRSFQNCKSCHDQNQPPENHGGLAPDNSGTGGIFAALLTLLFFIALFLGLLALMPAGSLSPG